MKKLLCCIAALLLLATVALADVTVIPLDHYIILSTATNCYYTSVTGGYQVFDAQGNALSAVYSDLTAKLYGLYYVYPGSGLNYMGLLDAQGQVLCEPTYGHISFLDDNWALAYVLEPTDADTGDFKDSSNNKYLTVRTDVLYQGHVICSLTRDEYNPSWTEGTTGGYLYLKKSTDEGMFIAPNGTITKVTASFNTLEFSDLGKKGIFHNPTQQNAFCAGCTLTKDDVNVWVWHDSSNDVLLDLQGNVIKSGVMYDSVKQYGDYMLIRHNGKYGIMDLEGNVIVEPVCGDINTNVGLFGNGYQAVVTENGCLQYIDTKGNVLASVDYELSESDYKGYYYNAPFAVVNNMGKYIVITAECGELPTKYEDYITPKNGWHILPVMQNGLWGAINLRGETVIPFNYTSLEISQDSMMVSVRDADGNRYIYLESSTADAPAVEVTVDDTTPAADDTTPVADDAWTCSCGSTNTGKFCPNCGASKPEVDDTAMDDGSWTCSCGAVNTGKFCPNCGTAKPEEPTVPTCSNCGYQPEGDAPNFCPECGNKF